MKKAMTKTMTDARTIPFFMYADEVDVTELIKMRKLFKPQHPTLTMLPFLVKAISLSMKSHPIVNCNINPDVDEDGFIHEYVIKKDHNFSIAIDTKDGLTVPIVKKVQTKSIL